MPWRRDPPCLAETPTPLNPEEPWLTTPYRRALRSKRKGRPYRRARVQMFMAYGTTCYVCGHPGATEAGHVTALATDPDQPTDPHQMRPMHGVSGRCSRCGGRACNQEMATKSLESMFRPKPVW